MAKVHIPRYSAYTIHKTERTIWFSWQRLNKEVRIDFAGVSYKNY